MFLSALVTTAVCAFYLALSLHQPLLAVTNVITKAEWEAEFERYKAFPEWQQRRRMTLEEFKHIYFWEVRARERKAAAYRSYRPLFHHTSYGQKSCSTGSTASFVVFL